MKHIFAAILSLTCACLFLSQQGVAQETVLPVVEVKLEQAETIPSQPVTLRITVLVPTWLAKPVNFPTFEAPNLMVRVFENGTNPISRAIKGDTWSGVTRVYHLYPMVPGPVEVPAQDLRILWAKPGVTDPIDSIVKTQKVEFLAKLPAGSENINPFIAAEDMELTQELSQDGDVLKPGDSFTRIVTATISGASPMFLPKLLPSQNIPGMASYPSEPKVSEEVKDSILSGVRIEQVTLVAQSGGSGALPAVEVTWFNLKTGSFETASVPEVSLTVDGPTAGSQIWSDPLKWVWVMSIFVVALLLILFFVKWFRPRLRLYFDEKKSAYRLSERWAFKQAEKALLRKDLGDFLNLLDVWAARCTEYDPRDDKLLLASLSQVGESVYGAKKHDQPNVWAAVHKAFLGARKELEQHDYRAYDPSKINPLTFEH